MSYFPMFIELKGRQCLVVGGGQVAYRKVKKLLRFGAEITVISPEILPEILAIGEVACQKIRHVRLRLAVRRRQDHPRAGEAGGVRKERCP